MAGEEEFAGVTRGRQAGRYLAWAAVAPVSFLAVGIDASPTARDPAAWLGAVLVLSALVVWWGEIFESDDEEEGKRHSDRDNGRNGEDEPAAGDASRYRRFFTEDLAGIYVATPDGRLLECNPAFTRIFRFESEAETLDCDLNWLYPSESSRSKFLEIVRTEGRLEDYEHELRRRDGAPVHVVENVIGEFDAKGELVELRGYVFDITERKKLEEQFRQSQKMEAIGRLAAGVAHDFSNLLTVILGNCELALHGLGTDDPRGRELEEIRDTVNRGTALTRRLLAFSRRQVLQPQVVDLNSLVVETLKMIRRLMGPHIEVDTLLEAELDPVVADPTQIEHVIVNLALNARDAMPEGGRLTIETSRVELDAARKTAELSLEIGSYVLLSLTDTGIGMDEETRARAFEPFFTTKSKWEGTGLGLSTVYGIVKQSEGDLRLSSEPGAGTTVEIYLPTATEWDQEFIRSGSGSGVIRGSGTILLVEDEKGLRKPIREFLERCGYEVLEADDGAEALRVAEEHKDRIDLLVTDLVMPGLSATELASRLSSDHPELRVLYMSGRPDSVIGRRGALKPGMDLLLKPFAPSELARRVHDALGENR